MIIHNRKTFVEVPDEVQIQYAKALSLAGMVMCQLDETELGMLYDVESVPNPLETSVSSLVSGGIVHTPVGDLSTDSVVFNTAMQCFNVPCRMAINFMTYTDRTHTNRLMGEGWAETIADGIESRLFDDVKGWEAVIEYLGKTAGKVYVSGEEPQKSKTKIYPHKKRLIGEGYTAGDIVGMVTALRGVEDLEMAGMTTFKQTDGQC